MVGKKTFESKTHFSFSLEERVPEDNLYRKLKEAIDWDFLYEAVELHYGTCGHQSIDPVVFFKLMLVGYLENVTSDRAIIRTSELRLDILYFLDYNLDEDLPWHSTLSRTRQRLPKEIFEKCFELVLKLCIEAGMVEGDIQAIDAAYVEANACLENMQAKDTQLDWQKYIQIFKSQDPCTTKEFSSNTDTMYALPKEKKRLRSNKSHYSPADPDSRMAKKKGKPCKLYHLASMSVDTFKHVITHINANFADEKDSRHLLEIAKETRSRLQVLDIKMHKILADGGFSSGANYAALEADHLEGYVSLYGQYNKQREGFTYDAKHDIYICEQGRKLSNKGVKSDGGYFNYHYRSSVTDCKDCPVKQTCCGKSPRKKMTFTAFRNHYDRMEKRLKSPLGRRMKKLRMSTVEPVFGRCGTEA
ncbi:IS1182 family transposase [Catalinimonas niigatensis]|uniref:IS1182 family transposase n=1 Tax=Catalinimonas niigatensis TaxID=1397264 RepID=UPI002666804D|nr:IS1182 family transposase [Catalinimonas niigatensis]WPP51963.1 IS1182 family transposase [Catalinimonas niigatensis]